MTSLILLARAPSASGKTRLTAGLTPDAAESLRTALLLDTFDALQRSGLPITVSYTPESAVDEMAALLGSSAARVIPQRDGDLGARMQAAIADACRNGASHAILVGADLPTLPASAVVDAASRLAGGHDLVLGPSEDGGYYLIGLRCGAPAETLFAGIAWGSATVLLETLAAAERAGLRTALVAPWYDVDRPGDLARVVEDARAEAAPWTRAWMDGQPR